MSRSKKGKKGPGWDYWGKRPLGYGAQSRKAKNKRKEKQEQKQRERAITKQVLRRASRTEP